MSSSKTYRKGVKKAKQRKNRPSILSVKKKRPKTIRILRKKKQQSTLKGGIASVGISGLSTVGIVALAALGGALLLKMTRGDKAREPTQSYEEGDRRYKNSMASREGYDQFVK